MNVHIETQLYCDSSIAEALRQQFLAVTTTNATCTSSIDTITLAANFRQMAVFFGECYVVKCGRLSFVS